MCAALAEADHETMEEAELLPPYCCAILLDGPSVAMDAAEVERGCESSGGGASPAGAAAAVPGAARQVRQRVLIGPIRPVCAAIVTEIPPTCEACAAKRRR
eukprot:COSAG01_NODE_4567_length_4918_cov_3.696203_3_plen_101_part_00